MAATKTRKKATVDVSITDQPNIYVKSNGYTAAHELAALKLLEEEGVNLAEYRIADTPDFYSISDGDSYYVFERIE